MPASGEAFCPGPRVTRAGAASGPLAGLGFAAKDLIDIAGETTGGGNPTWAATHQPAVATAPVVATLLAAGASLVGKTITDEMACGMFGENIHDGTPLNPAAPDRVPGGSSSGSGSAVARGQADFALGTDTGGSVRVPAAFCGIYGIRTSHGRVPIAGVMPMAPSFDTVGWLARDAALLRRVGGVILGDATAPRRGRLLIAVDAFAAIEPDVAAVLQGAAARLGPAEPVEVWRGGVARWIATFRPLQLGELWATLGGFVSRHKPKLGIGLDARFETAAAIRPAEIGPAMAERGRLIAEMAALLAGDAVLVLPTTHDVALLKGSDEAAQDAYRARTLPLTGIASLARLPQVSIPAGLVRGCPVGLSLVAAHGNDALLLAEAEAIGRLAP